MLHISPFDGIMRRNRKAKQNRLGLMC